VVLLAGMAGLAFFLMRRSRPADSARLTDTQRAAALQRVQEWMQASTQSTQDAAGGAKA
jgi:uncharacterized membrane protein